MGCEFEGNSASAETGGALHLVETEATLAGTAFRSNRAAWGGGAVFWQRVAPRVERAGAELCGAGSLNQAAWGPCVASNAHVITVQPTLGAPLYPGIPLAPIGVAMRDHYGQTLLTEAEALFAVVASLNGSPRTRQCRSRAR